MAAALLILLWMIALATIYFFSLAWLPGGISAYSATHDRVLHINLMVLGAVFVAAQALLGMAVFRFRAKSREASENTRALSPKHTYKYELGFLLAAVALFFGLNAASERMFAARANETAGASNAKRIAARPVKVEAVGAQYRWYFRYAGADGKLGRTRPELQDAELGNPLGIDARDRFSADDRVTAALVLPADEPVALTLRSHDVIHSFFVAALRFKQDAVPGMNVAFELPAMQPGEYEIVCAELCGTGHHSMNAKLRVLPRAEFDGWMAGGGGK